MRGRRSAVEQGIGDTVWWVVPPALGRCCITPVLQPVFKVTEVGICPALPIFRPLSVALLEESGFVGTGKSWSVRQVGSRMRAKLLEVCAGSGAFALLRAVAHIDADVGPANLYTGVDACLGHITVADCVRWDLVAVLRSGSTLAVHWAAHG